jgi:hypothetical protein
MLYMLFKLMAHDEEGNNQIIITGKVKYSFMGSLENILPNLSSLA